MSDGPNNVVQQPLDDSANRLRASRRWPTSAHPTRRPASKAPVATAGLAELPPSSPATPAETLPSESGELVPGASPRNVPAEALPLQSEEPEPIKAKSRNQKPTSGPRQAVAAEQPEPRCPKSRNPSPRRWTGTSSRSRAIARSRSARVSCGGWRSPGWTGTSARSSFRPRRSRSSRAARNGSSSGSFIPAISSSRWKSTRTRGSWSARRRGSATSPGRPGIPTPMLPHEVAADHRQAGGEDRRRPPKLKIDFDVGDHVKINEGTFENFEGEVDEHRRDQRAGDGDDQDLRPHARPWSWSTGRSNRYSQQEVG